MKSRLVLLLLAAHAGAALAQYKCIAASGAVTFQQTPCFGAKSEEKLVVIPNGHPPPATGASAPRAAAPVGARVPASQAGPGTNMRMLADYERKHQRDPLEQALRDALDDKARRAEQRAQAIAAAQKQFGDDPANAAALRDAVAAVDSRYNALGEIDESRVRSAQAALDSWDRGQVAGASGTR